MTHGLTGPYGSKLRSPKLAPVVRDTFSSEAEVKSFFLKTDFVKLKVKFLKIYVF